MCEYVVVYAFTVDEAQHRIPMVIKDRPDYLKGCLNLPGGKINIGETPIDAAVRELKEETGLEDLSVTDGMCPMSPEVMGKITHDKSVIYCVKVPITSRQELMPQDGETEPVAWYDVATVLTNLKLMPNLRIVLPLIEVGVKDWEIVSYGDWRGYFQKLEVIVPGMEFYDDLRPIYEFCYQGIRNEC